jgi:ABC-type nitrate/sulfonate/bicarbonate transport system substrate-binding protein
MAVAGLIALAVLASATACGGSAGAAAAAAPAATSAAAAAAAGTRPEVAKVDLIMDWEPWVLDIPIDVAQAGG